MYAPQLASDPDPTQPPVGPALEQLAEEFTQLAFQGKLLEIQEMINEKTQESEGKFDIVNITNARQQTVSEFDGLQ